MSGGGRMRSVPDCVAKEQETALRKVVASLGWALEPIPADGSCQFAALARLNSQFTAQSLRRAVAASAPSHPPPQLEGAVLRWYLDSLHKPDTWGDEYTLQRAGECASCRVYVLRADCLDTWELVADPTQAAHTALRSWPTERDITTQSTLLIGFLQRLRGSKGTFHVSRYRRSARLANPQQYALAPLPRLSALRPFSRKHLHLPPRARACPPPQTYPSRWRDPLHHCRHERMLYMLNHLRH